jgi:hypothetical protein
MRPKFASMGFSKRAEPLSVNIWQIYRELSRVNHIYL